MTPDDEKRLAEIRASKANWWGGYDGFEDVEDLLRMFDESDRARIAAEAALTTASSFADEHMNALRTARDRMKARAETAESALADSQALVAQHGECALVAERVLAEERAKREAAEASVARELAWESRVTELEKALDTSKWDDAHLPEDAAIDAAHPLKTKRHDLFSEAMRLVGARRSKGGLVELVNWLLAMGASAAARYLDAEARVADLEADLEAERFACKRAIEESELQSKTARLLAKANEELQALIDAADGSLARELAAKETG